MDEELKPCPICGGAVEFSNASGGYMAIECTVCHASTEYIYSKKELVTNWNKGDREDCKLKPLRFCPVCGAPAEYYRMGDAHKIGCTNEDVCGFMTPAFLSYEEAADFWNGEVKNG